MKCFTFNMLPVHAVFQSNTAEFKSHLTGSSHGLIVLLPVKMEYSLDDIKSAENSVNQATGPVTTDPGDFCGKMLFVQQNYRNYNRRNYMFIKKP